MENASVEIEKDTSGKTYGYYVYIGKELYLYGDGYDSPESALQDLEKMRKVLNSALK